MLAQHQPPFILAAALLLALFGGGLAFLPPHRAWLFAFDGAALAYLALTWRVLHGAKAARLRQLARRYDPDRPWRIVVSIAVVLAVTGALFTEIAGAKTFSAVDLLLAALTLLLGWLFVNTVYAVHYAHSFYVEDRRHQGGLTFPGTDEPEFSDFVYFAFVLGMTFQVSDVAITNPTTRQMATLHGLVGFVFNVVVLAMAVNIAVGLTN